MNSEQFMTLHRHWIWCEIIKGSFELEIKKHPPDKVKQKMEHLMLGPYGAYMSIWYGMLFSILETLKGENVTIPNVESEIKDIYKPLRLYRNAVFHPQPKYWSHKLFEIMKDTESSSKIWKTHNAISKYFLKEIDTRRNNNLRRKKSE